MKFPLNDEYLERLQQNDNILVNKSELVGDSQHEYLFTMLLNHQYNNKISSNLISLSFSFIENFSTAIYHFIDFHLMWE